jgi:RNA polymerase sigma factor (sigma-70 family)
VARYLAVRDEEAFRLLVSRHGPRVFCTCRRMLRQRQDAEDAFQAVFVTLAGYGRALRRVRSLGGWLHNVSVRVCHGVLRANRRREQHLRAGYQQRSDLAQSGGPELRLLLDEELTALPSKYREVLVLCDLEGHTREEAARKIGASAGTVATWLARGRKRLRERLVKRGVSISAAGIATALSRSAEALQGVTFELVDQTVRHAELFLAGKSAAPLPAAEKIGSLAQGVFAGDVSQQIEHDGLHFSHWQRRLSSARRRFQG